MAALNRFEILSRSYDLEFSAFSTAGPKFQTCLDRPFLASVTSNLARDLLRYPHNYGSARDRKLQHFENMAHSNCSFSLL